MNNPSLDALPISGILQPDGRAERPGFSMAGAGTPVVMLHASLSSRAQWTALVDRLAPRYRTIALDLCGYGDSAVPAGRTPFTLDDEVRFVAERLDRLVDTSTRFHLVGHSYGGVVALRFAQSRSNRIASLSLYEPVAFGMLDDEDAAEMARLANHLSGLIQARHREEATQAFVDFWSGAGTYESLPLPARVGLARRVDKVPLDFQAASCWPRTAEDLRTIVAPTLLLVGNRGPAIAERMHARLARALPNGRVGPLEAGHMGPITDAHRVNHWIEAFVDVCEERHAAFAAPRTAISSAMRGSAGGPPFGSTSARLAHAFDQPLSGP